MQNITVWQANLRRDEVNCKKGARHLVLRGRFQRNNSWDIGQRMAMLDTIMTGFQCAPVYIIQAPTKKSDDVFDGAHRLETACDFVTNKYPIQKVDSDFINWETSPLAKYEGKYYRDIDDADQLLFDNYSFVINTISTEVAEDPERLATLWVRLNNSGNRLNDYEKYIPVYYTLYEFLKDQSRVWLGTHVHSKKVSSRGDAEIQVMKLLALSEAAIPAKFSSQLDMYKKWRLATFGKTTEVEANFCTKKDDLTVRLKHLYAVYERLMKHLPADIHISPTDPTPLMLIGRIARWCDTKSMLTRCESKVFEYARVILETPTDDIVRAHGCTSANAKYQLRLLYGIDRDIHDIVEQLDDARLFTPTQKTLKLREQCDACPWCKKPIEWGQKIEGHHIVPYSKGGPTTLANLQVLHVECHTALHARS